MTGSGEFGFGKGESQDVERWSASEDKTAFAARRDEDFALEREVLDGHAMVERRSGREVEATSPGKVFQLPKSAD